ncbi:outer membrane beta-barrel protein [Verrucomicrobiaceae bacterium R5-34]|uniref:Outer membrane beta-barrel protein n=1 Tax=Oceaniferula flava TaxID=2800421 RepID=A0AAE2SGM4_9BACT|nr:outer membrane beta-barrel protein [Oceaniferula flavus]MBK1832306.1 outer membrane beta-barrel protein [Verrucomicrobiaceae bacterium R5-34]MBK1856532.1 outer membrane beta-barrel protein [Oceaniferula flavus]MBM1137839.1 outer membrane beta-barrel protein [Oceaniferula flavus]
MKSPFNLTPRPFLYSLAIGAVTVPGVWAQTDPSLVNHPAVVPVGAGLDSVRGDGPMDLTEDSVSPEVAAAAEGSSDFSSLFTAAVRGSMRLDDNMFLTPDDEDSDVIITITPTLQLANDEDAKNTWSFAYAPSIISYLDNSNLNSVNNSFALELGTRLPKTEIDFSADYSEISGSDRFVSGQIDKTTYGAKLDLTHELTGKTRLDATLGYAKTDYETASLFDTTAYDLLLTWQYQYSGKISLGPYVSYGETEVDTQPDHQAIGVGIKFDYEMTGKTAMIGKLGYENRSFSGPMAGSDHNLFTYEIGLSHEYSGKTEFQLMLYRRSNASYSIASSGYYGTGLFILGTHDMTDRLTLKSKLAYERDSYYATSTVSAADLDSHYYEFNMGADYEFNDQCTFGMNFIWRSNDSETDSSDFDNLALELFSTYYF